jgi:cation:H+ antiporter
MIPMIGTTVMCIILGWDRVYSRLDGAILFGTFILYMYYLYIDERKYYRKEDNRPQSEEVANGIPNNWKEALRDTVLSIAALGVTILSATYVLQITEIVVDRTGVGGSLIGVLTLGVASAMPELITALSGIKK